MDIRKFQESDRTQVIALWERCELVPPLERSLSMDAI
jgi:hypothetical protein